MKLKQFLICLVASMTIAAQSWAADGMTVVKSENTSEVTMDRLEAAVLEKGMKVFARIDHAAGAAKIGKTLRPTELLIFGNPQGGTPFMECAQTVGIDLPLKMLVWEDVDGQVWLGYNDVAYIAQRHAAADCPVVGPMSKALAGFASSATGR